MADIRTVQDRWQRRYAGRRWVMGAPVGYPPIGTLVDQYIEFDIAVRRVVHALRPGVYRLLRVLTRMFYRLP